jgi:hypothetical protein
VDRRLKNEQKRRFFVVAEECMAEPAVKKLRDGAAGVQDAVCDAASPDAPPSIESDNSCFTASSTSCLRW